MLLLPFVFGIIFLLTLALKLLGGNIAWWIVITMGLLFIIPLMIFLFISIYSHKKNR